jgi:hypothetical protein
LGLVENMDRIAKHVAGRLKAQPAPGPHPDAELLSAFAENALSAADRGPLLQHLGVCSDCREIVFLALPESAEAQKVLVLKPSRFRRWGFRGALVASVAVVAIFFTTNRLAHRNQTTAKLATMPAAAPETETKIAAETPPAELDQIQSARAGDKTKVPTTLSATESKPQPEAKHMTAKLQPELVFEDSGEVRVRSQQKSPDVGVLAKKGAGNLEAFARPTTAPSASRGYRPAAAGQSGVVQADTITESNPVPGYAAGAPADATLPLKGRNTANLQVPAPVAASPQSTGVSVNGALLSAAGGNLGGIVSDPSGAAVGNAKVTTIGPAGAESATSDSQGKFSFDRLPPGLYSLTAEASGFRTTEIKQVAVLDNKTSTIPVTLAVGTESEVVNVTGAALAVESSTASVGEPQQMAQFSMQKATAARAKGQAVGGPIGSGARVAMLQWTLSRKGAVQRSSDSGKTWQTVSVADAAGFRALSAVGANIWVGGKAGALYHSPDSGQTWIRVEPAAEGKKLDQDIVSLDFADGLVGTISTANGGVWTTSDGGQTWQRK